MANAGGISGLNRCGITLNNALALVAALYTIYTTGELYNDPDYNHASDRTWWQNNWQAVIGIIFSVIMTALSTAALVALGAYTVGQVMGGVLAYIGFGVTGALAGGLVGYFTGGHTFAAAADGALKGWEVGMWVLTFVGFVMMAAEALADTADVTVIEDGPDMGNTSKAQAAAVKPRCCFAAGTIVLTEEGQKKIEDIEAGDKVWAYDEETGEKELKTVVRLFRNKASTKTQLTIKADDGTIDKITSTPGHKYYLPDNDRNRNACEKLEHASYEGLSEKWASACELKKGDRVLLANANSLTSKPKYGIVIGVKTEECEEFTTYNFEVEDFHTYYVGKNSVCVHNRGCNNLVPDPNAKGAHSTFRRDPTTGKITHYATYEPNPYRPSGFDEVLRFDGIGGAHTNKITLLDIPTPHIHGKSIPGGVGIPEFWQLPKGYYGV